MSDLDVVVLDYIREQPKRISIQDISTRHLNDTVSIELYFDGGSLGNPGLGYGSYAFRKEGMTTWSVMKRREEFGKEMTNNQAEYTAAIRGVQNVIKTFGSDLDLAIFGDSELLVKQVKGEYRVKNPELRILYDELTQLLQGCGEYELTHVPRDQIEAIFGH